MFAINHSKGFQITFANGWTASVQFGPGNYCDNRNNRFFAATPHDSQCANAEFSVIGDCVEGEPEGWQTPADILRLLNEVAQRPQFVPQQLIS